MSHHSSEFDPEMEQKARQFFEQNLGPTGNFPHGQLTKHDEGEIAFAVGSKDGKVVIDFNSPVHWLGMTPEQAEELGQLLIKHAKNLKG